MYGIVNQSIQQLIKTEFGEETWLNVIRESKLEITDFENHEVYDDTYTYALATAAAKILHSDIDTILNKFGEFWIIDISLKKYPALMHGGGSTLREFMKNLPKFHNRIALSYPKLSAPEFKIIEEGNNLLVEYHSERAGLTPMMNGMLIGLTKMFNETDVVIELIEKKSEKGNNYDLFRMTWN